MEEGAEDSAVMVQGPLLKSWGLCRESLRPFLTPHFKLEEETWMVQ